MTDSDPRVRCVDCRCYRGGYCSRAQLAGLSRTRPTLEVGPDLAHLPQHCGAHQPLKARPR